MARPFKGVQHRLPRWHSKRRRWRLTIEHAHGTKECWFEGAEGASPPPHVIAAAVAVQDHWFEIKADWKSLQPVMSIVRPNECWLKPVFLTREEIAAAESQARVSYAAETREYHVETVQSAVAMGFDTFVATLAQSGVCDHPDDAWMSRFNEQQRLTLLTLLYPAQHRAVLRPTTVEDAIDAYVVDQRQRIDLKAGDNIRPETFNASRSDLLRAFGLASGKQRERTRETPISPDDLMHTINRDRLVEFARYWQRMPKGIGSKRTIKNLFAAVRPFLNWAGRQPFGFHRIDDLKSILASESAKRAVKPFDAAEIRSVLARGRSRLKLYALLGED